MHIGVFDSGVGGLSVLKSLQTSRPELRYTYFADSSHAPYGSLDSDTLLDYSKRIVTFLQAEGAELIVVACNTITTELIGELRRCFDLPFVGIEPAVKPAAQHSVNGRVGVLATERTLKSAGYRTTCEKFAAEVTLIERVGTGLVEAIEKLPWTGDELRASVQRFTEDFKANGIDTLVLGCTHYLLIEPLFSDLLGKEISIVSASDAVARRVEQITPNAQSDQKGLQCFTSGSAEHLEELMKRMSFNSLQSVTHLPL